MRCVECDFLRKNRIKAGNIGNCNIRTARKTYEKRQAAMEEINATSNRNVGIVPFNVTHGQVNFRGWGVLEKGENKRNSCIQIFESLWNLCWLVG